MEIHIFNVLLAGDQYTTAQHIQWTVRLSLTYCYIQIKLNILSKAYCYVFALVWGQGQRQCISIEIMCFLPDISQNYDHISPDNKIWQAILTRHLNSGKCIFCVVLVNNTNCCRPSAASYNKTQQILPDMTSRVQENLKKICMWTIMLYQ